MFKSIVPMIFVRGGSILLTLAAFLYLYLGYPYLSKVLATEDRVSLQNIWRSIGFGLLTFGSVLAEGTIQDEGYVIEATGSASCYVWALL